MNLVGAVNGDQFSKMEISLHTTNNLIPLPFTTSLKYLNLPDCHLTELGIAISFRESPVSPSKNALW